MSETNYRTGTPLLEDEHVKELMTIMQKNRVNTTNLSEMLNYVSAVEKQLDTAVNELAVMRRELNEMKGAQKSPTATLLRNAIHSMDSSLKSASERLVSVKESIIANCKHAVSAFKEKGISALNNVSEFFKFGQTLGGLKKALANGIESADKGISVVQSVSEKYHEAGRRIKNVGRVLSDKEMIHEASPIGKLATALQTPFQKEKMCLSAALNSVNKAIDRLDQLNKSASKIKETREEKPSILGNIKKLQEQVTQDKNNTPSTSKTKTQETSL